MGDVLEMTKNTGADTVEEGPGSHRRRCYSRSQLEAWRHVDPEQQRSLWDEIYRSLGSDVTLGYDGLLGCAPPKKVGKSESRRQKARKKRDSALVAANLLHGREGEVLEMRKNNEIEIAEEGPRNCPRRCYTRNELMALMHVNPEQQRSRWDEIYRSFGSALTLEYDGILDSTSTKQAEQSESRRQKAMKKKEPALEGGARWDKLVEDIGTEDNVPKMQWHSDLHEPSCREHSMDGEVPNYEEEEEEDNDEDEYIIHRPAFLVEGEPDFDSGPPQDGLEYLRRVRWEAAQIPKVKVAKVDARKHSEQTPYMPKIPEIKKCPEMLLPLKAWEDAFLQDFSELRLSFTHFESSTERLALPMPSNSDPAHHSQSTQPTDLPTLSKILARTAASRASLLMKHIGEFQDEDKLSRERCLWLFALCAVVDTPLYAELSASIRSLLRKCSSLLASRSDPDEEVAMLNILVAISGRYFGQSEEGRS